VPVALCSGAKKGGVADMQTYDVVVLGAGPAGLAAGIAANENGASVLIIERESKPGGILKQCIHDGFGLIRFGEKLTGPEYAQRYVKMVREQDIMVMTSTFVLKVEKDSEGFVLKILNSQNGVFNVCSKALILANGCRERTVKQVGIHGTRPAGVLTAGTAQRFVNIEGFLPCKKCVILGSGDIGLIMARRLTLEGAKVEGVYEAKAEPSGLSRNIAQCLDDFSIPLHLSSTVTKIFGSDRVEAVEISQVDGNMNPILGTERVVECDGLILSVGLIPENEIAQSLGLSLDPATKGPRVDQNFMTEMDGVFLCGNALHVSDLVDYVSESGEYAGKAAAGYTRVKKLRTLVPVVSSQASFIYAVPQYINLSSQNLRPTLYFRSRGIVSNKRVQVKCGETMLFDKKYSKLKPPEMERINFDIASLTAGQATRFSITMTDG